jgi:hypothetical protein
VNKTPEYTNSANASVDVSFVYVYNHDRNLFRTLVVKIPEDFVKFNVGGALTLLAGCGVLQRKIEALK